MTLPPIESKDNHLGRKYAFYWRYDTDPERAVLNPLWPLVNDRLNYLTPTIKPVGFASTADGRRRRPSTLRTVGTSSTKMRTRTCPRLSRWISHYMRLSSSSF